MKNLFKSIYFLCFLILSSIIKAQTSDGICTPSTTVTAINRTNPVPPNPVVACSSGVGLPTYDPADGSLPDDEFVVEINGVIDVTNTTGLPAAALSDGDVISVSAFTYDLVSINTTLGNLNGFCSSVFVNCDVVFMAPGIEQALSDLVNGVNDGEAGINDLAELFTFASAFGTPITSVAAASAAIDSYNAQGGATAGNICYASSTPEVYTIDDGNVACSLLPVELTEFNAIPKDAGIQLLWQTESEINNDGFEIQVSTDFSNWRSLGFVEGNGTTNEKHTYTFWDEKPVTGINYYRLKQIDFDGHFEYSKIIKAEQQRKISKNNLVVFPNPVTQILNYSVDELSEIQSVEIFGLNGNLIKRADRIVGTLEVGDLKNGIYLLAITTNGEHLKQLFIKN